MFYVLILLFLCSYKHMCIFAQKECGENELIVKYSDCDSNGVRWMYKIPKANNNCSLDNNSIPRKIYNCGNTCSGGFHLNLNTHECEKCVAGTFSKGDVYEVSKWNSIPPEFSVDVTRGELDPTDCSKYGWLPKGDVLLGKTGGGCAVTLSLQLFNSKPGNVTFVYQIVKYGAMAFFAARNEHCSQIPGASHPLKYTGANRYDKVTIKIPEGHNVVQWYLFVENPLLQHLYGFEDPEVLIKNIYISGTPPIFNCTPCPAGTFAESPGAEHCELCPRDTYSQEGQTQCTKCPANEYASPGSSSCLPKKPCAPNDYHSHWTTCDNLDQTKQLHRWTTPKICNEQTGVTLPAPSAPENCASCPIGTYPLNETNCALCPKDLNQLPNTKYHHCIQCSNQQLPLYGLDYTNWSRLPPLIELNCADYFGKRCDVWDLMRDSLRGGIGQQPGELATMKLNIKRGFVTTNQGSFWENLFFVKPPIPHTYLNIQFSLHCESICHLNLKEVSHCS